jgi:hypothetical protein
MLDCTWVRGSVYLGDEPVEIKDKIDLQPSRRGNDPIGTAFREPGQVVLLQHHFGVPYQLGEETHLLVKSDHDYGQAIKLIRLEEDGWHVLVSRGGFGSSVQYEIIALPNGATPIGK